VLVSLNCLPFVTCDIMICLQVISLLKDDALFIRQLFARMRSSDISMESKRELVRRAEGFIVLVNADLLSSFFNSS